MWGMIGTWRMALEGITLASPLLANQGGAGEAIEEAIKQVEDFPYFKSVGYGGLPNEAMEVELDAAYMDGTTFNFGAVCAIKDFANPIAIARKLSDEIVNNVLVGTGAERFAQQQGFERKNMLSERAKLHYENRLFSMKQEPLKAYSGHDTVGMVALDSGGDMVAGTSTSGLFMKKPGRVGDSAIIGSGLYVDSQVGGATATGLGEDIMKGVLSYAIVNEMRNGMSPQQACEKVVFQFEKQLRARREQVGDISVVAMNNKGEWGCASTIANFSFVVSDASGIHVYCTRREGEHMNHTLATQEWLANYLEERMRPLQRLSEGYDEY